MSRFFYVLFTGEQSAKLDKKEASVMASAREAAQEKKWEAEEAAQTLIRTEEIRADKELLKAAQKELKSQQKAINKVISRRKK